MVFVQHSEYTKCHGKVHFKMANFKLYDFHLDLKTIAKEV